MYRFWWFTVPVITCHTCPLPGCHGYVITPTHNIHVLTCSALWLTVPGAGPSYMFAFEGWRFWGFVNFRFWGLAARPPRQPYPAIFPSHFQEDFSHTFPSHFFPYISKPFFPIHFQAIFPHTFSHSGDRTHSYSFTVPVIHVLRVGTFFKFLLLRVCSHVSICHARSLLEFHITFSYRMTMHFSHMYPFAIWGQYPFPIVGPEPFHIALRYLSYIFLGLAPLADFAFEGSFTSIDLSRALASGIPIVTFSYMMTHPPATHVSICHTGGQYPFPIVRARTGPFPYFSHHLTYLHYLSIPYSLLITLHSPQCTAMSKCIDINCLR